MLKQKNESQHKSKIDAYTLDDSSHLSSSNKNYDLEGKKRNDNIKIKVYHPKMIIAYRNA